MPDSVDLHQVATTLVSGARGILAADESIATMSTRLEGEGVAPTESNRRDYRELLLTAPDLSRTVSGIILCDETFHQEVSDGTAFPLAARRLGILPGVKVDAGVVPFPGASRATVTQGLDNLSARLEEYSTQGAAFAKWRAVIDVADPNEGALEANAAALAEYALACQQNGIVPIVEPEVLCSGAHDLSACAEVTTAALMTVFDHLEGRDVDLGAIVLKPNLVTQGLSSSDTTTSPLVVAEATLAVLRSTVPMTVPGIAFLSGGHPNTDACDYLAAVNQLAGDAPWRLTYSFGRALVSDALHAWGGERSRVSAAQQLLLENCERASRATRRAVAA